MKKIIILFLSLLLIITIRNPAIVHAEEMATTADVISTNNTIDAMSTAIYAPVLPLGPPAVIAVHRVSNVCFVYDTNYQLLNGFVVSTGKPDHQTPLGTYQIYEHTTSSGYHLMVDGTYGRWCMRFKKGGYMFHSVCYAYKGALEPLPEEVAALGNSVSRGCIRLNVTDAEWLYNNTPNGCLVVITDD